MSGKPPAPGMSRRTFLATTATTAAGAPALTDDSQDAALLLTLPPGPYTLHVSSRRAGEAGVVLAEVFLLAP